MGTTAGRLTMNQYIITEEKLVEIESTPNEDTKEWKP